MNLLTALLNRPSPEIRLDDYPDRPLDNGERRARWAMLYFALSNHDKELSNELSGLVYREINPHIRYPSTSRSGHARTTTPTTGSQDND